MVFYNFFKFLLYVVIMHRIQEFLPPELKQCTLLFHPFAPHFAAAAAFLQGFDCFDLRDLFNGICAIPPIDQT